MSAQPAEHDEPYEKIHLGGVEAAIVPMDELRVLRALREQATPEALAAAELAAEIAEDAPHLAEYRQWVADGRPGEVSQEEMERAFADLRQ
jgi:hypothetical protein